MRRERSSWLPLLQLAAAAGSRYILYDILSCPSLARRATEQNLILCSACWRRCIISTAAARSKSRCYPILLCRGRVLVAFRNEPRRKGRRQLTAIKRFERSWIFDSSDKKTNKQKRRCGRDAIHQRQTRYFVFTGNVLLTIKTNGFSIVMYLSRIHTQHVLTVEMYYKSKSMD